MKVHAVAKVRLDADGRVTGVEWGPVNTETNEWHTEPAIADVSEVVAALQRGDDVFALFPTGARHDADAALSRRRVRQRLADRQPRRAADPRARDPRHAARRVLGRPAVSSGRPWVACLCAAWCVACREYGATFAALAAQFGADADFAWIDIEDDADALGDLDIENFPTLLIADAAGARFFGPVMPQASDRRAADPRRAGRRAGRGRRSGLGRTRRRARAEAPRRPSAGISLQPGDRCRRRR